MLLLAVFRRFAARFQPTQSRGQGLLEFALVLPLLLLFILGIIEVGRMLAIYSSLSSAAKQAARYGSVAGDSGTTVGGEMLAFYEDCGGIKDTALRTSILVGLDEGDIGIGYDRGSTAEPIGRCALGAETPTLSETIKDGYRVIISVTAIYRPLVPIVPLPDLPITFSAARTIFTTIVGPTNTPLPNPDVYVTKRGSPAVVSPNGTLTYWITATNNITSGTIAHNIVVTDTLPLSVTLTASNLEDIADDYNWDCTFLVQSPPPQQIECVRLAPLTAGQSSGFSYAVQVPLFGGVTLTNTTGVAMSDTDIQPGNNYTYTVHPVLPGADLQVFKNVNSATVGAGTPLTYTVWVVNNGGDISRVRTSPPAQASYIWITDTLPAGAKLKQLPTVGTGWQCPNVTLLSTTIGCRYTSDLAISGSTPNITLVLTAPVTAGTLNNTVVVTPSNQTADPLPLNNTVTATAQIVTDADLELFLAGPGEAKNINTPFTYRLNVTNRGPSVASGIVLTDTLPAGLAYQSGTGWAGCTHTAGVVVCTYAGTLYPGSTTSDLTLTVAGTAEGQHTNVADVRASQPDPDAPDINPNTDNHASTVTSITDCQTGRVDLASSSVSGGSPDQVQTQSGVSQVRVTLKHKCGGAVENVNVVLEVSGVASNITVASGYSNPTNATGEIVFDIRSDTAGSATYTPRVTSADNAQVGVALNGSASVAFYGCVEVTGQSNSNSNQTFVDYRINNESGRNWKLIELSLDYNTSGGRKLSQIVMDTTPAVTLWSGNSGSDPFTVPGSGAWANNTDGARTIGNGVVGQSLLFHFSKSTPGNLFSLNTKWDDGNGHTCTVDNSQVTP